MLSPRLLTIPPSVSLLKQCVTITRHSGQQAEDQSLQTISSQQRDFAWVSLSANLKNNSTSFHCKHKRCAPNSWKTEALTKPWLFGSLLFPLSFPFKSRLTLDESHLTFNKEFTVETQRQLPLRKALQLVMATLQSSEHQASSLGFIHLLFSSLLFLFTGHTDSLSFVHQSPFPPPALQDSGSGVVNVPSSAPVVPCPAALRVSSLLYVNERLRIGFRSSVASFAVTFYDLPVSLL